jgi:hypothetical protein
MKQNQPKRITYLFGAGASIGNGKLLSDDKPTGIPVVEKFNDDIRVFLDLIDDLDIMSSGEEKMRQFNNMKIMFKGIYNEFSHMYSFDTFAKSLYEQGSHQKLNNLKLLLKAYLLYRQEVCKSDPRYDLLFATLINNGILPNHVNFLSWNYDTQVEKSLTRFAGNSHNGFKQFIDLGFKPQNSIKSNLLKLNGSISVRKDYTKNYHCIETVTDDFSETILPICEEIVALYSSEERDYLYPKMYFSWEEKERFEEVLEYSKHVISKTDILIVIGYSFPTLNRKEDMLLLKCLPDHARICIQCKDESDFKEIKSKISSLVKVSQDDVTASENDEFYREYPFKSVEFIPQSREFYVPFEFDY